MAYFSCPGFKREAQTFTEVSNYVFTISDEEAEIIKREIYYDVTDTVLREQLEVLIGTHQLVFFTEYDWTQRKHEGPHSVDNIPSFGVDRFLKEKSQGRIVGNYHSIFDVDDDLSVIRVHSWHGQTEHDKQEPNPGFNKISEQVGVALDMLRENRSWYEAIHGIDVNSVIQYLQDIVLLGKCRFNEAVAQLLKEFGIRFKTGLMKSFRTRLKEAALLIHKKLMRKVSMAELMFMQRLPLEIKVRKTLLRIREWYENYDGQVYCSFSGGIDSTVLAYLVRSLYPDVPCVFVDTGLEHPDVRSFALSYTNTVVLKPKMSFPEVIKRYGYPLVSKQQAMAIRKLTTQNLSEKYRNKLLFGDERGSAGKLSERWKFLLDAPFKISEKCCDVLKKQPVHDYSKKTGRMPLVGTLAEESRNRTNQYLHYGCNAFEKNNPTSTPLGFWTTQDILRFLVEYEIPYSKAYGEIIEVNGQLTTTREKSTGCQFCAFGVHLEQGENRYQRMAREFPKRHKYCMETLGMDIVLNYMGIDYLPVSA